VIVLAASLVIGCVAPALGETSRESGVSTSHRSQSQAAPAGKGIGQEPVYANLHARAWKLLDAAAVSDKVRTRSDAFSAISILESNRHAVELMITGLDDKDEGVRTLAANSLGGMNSPAAIPALRKAMNDPSPVVSFAAAKSLWRLGDRSGREMFYEVLAGERKTQPGFIKSHVNEVKKDIHDPKTLALIGINQASGQFLGPFSMGVSMLEEYAKNTSSPVQALCANLLAQDETPDTIEQLSLALDNNNWTVRAAAAKALANMRDRRVIAKLDEMMSSDKEPAARLAAAAAIVKLTD
jgi:HEAT repeat protein